MEKSFPGQEDDQARRVALLAEPRFFFFVRVNGSQRFLQKCMKSWLTQGSSDRWMTHLLWTTFLHIKYSNSSRATSENVLQIITLDGEESEPSKPSNTVRSLIPDTNNLESSNGIHNLAKKRRSFIPTEEYAEPEASKSESSVAPTVALTSGDSDDSESGLTGIRALALISMFLVHNLQ